MKDGRKIDLRLSPLSGETNHHTYNRLLLHGKVYLPQYTRSGLSPFKNVLPCFHSVSISFYLNFSIVVSSSFLLTNVSRSLYIR